MSELYSFDELISTLEQKGAIQVLLYLEEHEYAKLSQLIRDIPKVGQTAIYTAIRKLMDLDLIEEEKEPPYNRRYFSLTPRGLKVAEIQKK